MKATEMNDNTQSVDYDSITKGQRVIVEPNEWERDITDESLSESEQSYRQFFTEMVEAYSERRPSWYKLKPGPRNYLTFSAGVSRIRFGWVFHQGPEFAVELYISTPDKERNEEIFDSLRENREEIESNMSAELKWERLSEKQACRIKWPKQIETGITELTTDQRSQLVTWGADVMDDFQSEFEPQISEL